jgi:hypothetical protein
VSIGSESADEVGGEIEGVETCNCARGASMIAMAPAKKQELSKQRRHLAGLIGAALKKGQRGDGVRELSWAPWTNVAFTGKVAAEDSTVRDWRDRNRPVPPVNIMPLLRVFYGDHEKFAEARSGMMKAWRRATGTAYDPVLGPREIETCASADELVYTPCCRLRHISVSSTAIPASTVILGLDPTACTQS